MAEVSERTVQMLRRKQIREPPAIPFLWESRPGVPIKNWKPENAVKGYLQPAVNLVASVPFVWEEKPGTPIRFLVTGHDEFSESDWDSESMGSCRTGTDDSESVRSIVATRKVVPTLGELIMMSRRMSIQRRHNEMRNLSMDMMMKQRGMSCFNITKMVGLVDLKMKIQPLLKFA